MCTLSWSREEGRSYQLYFSRDELKQRAEALSPQVNRLALYPIDPPSQGTWIALNKAALSFCVLNDYSQNYDPQKVECSRGQLIMQLLDAQHLEQVQKKVAMTSFEKFAPFKLVVLSLQSPAWICTWNGRVKHYRTVDQDSAVITSSSLQPQAVALKRMEYFEYLQQEGFKGADLLKRFHFWHDSEDPSSSVCMHRTDRQTVSLTQISVRGFEHLSMIYQQGAPCAFENSGYELSL